MVPGRAKLEPDDGRLAWYAIRIVFGERLVGERLGEDEPKLRRSLEVPRGGGGGGASTSR